MRTARLTLALLLSVLLLAHTTDATTPSDTTTKEAHAATVSSSRNVSGFASGSAFGARRTAATHQDRQDQPRRLRAARPLARCIAHYESTDGAHLYNGPNLGPWQINVTAHPWVNPRRVVTDWWYSARVAYRISAGGRDWSAWSTIDGCAGDRGVGIVSGEQRDRYSLRSEASQWDTPPDEVGRRERRPPRAAWGLGAHLREGRLPAPDALASWLRGSSRHGGRRGADVRALAWIA
jgi:hypothetical protein